MVNTINKLFLNKLTGSSGLPLKQLGSERKDSSVVTNNALEQLKKCELDFSKILIFSLTIPSCTLSKELTLCII